MMRLKHSTLLLQLGSMLQALYYMHSLQHRSKLHSDMNNVLTLMLDHFGNKPFLRHQAQLFPLITLENTNDNGEVDFKKFIKPVSICNVSVSLNVVSSHIVHKLKLIDDIITRLKSRIASHGNRECAK